MKVLFLCTGNYYRSRMAEELFNTYYAPKNRAEICGDSSALLADLSQARNEGPISSYAVTQLEKHAIPIRSRHRFPKSAQLDEILNSDIVIAVNRAEHEKMVHERFPSLANKVRYWNVPDLNLLTAEEAFVALQKNVLELVEEIL